MGERIAIFGGSFDPIHHGHLILAQDALQELRLDRLIFVPAGINPHKQCAPQATNEQRLEMLQLAILGEPRFQVDPLELERKGPSFTSDTVETFKNRWPDATLFLLLGEDNLAKLHTWNRFESLKSWVHFISFGRSTPISSPSFTETSLHLNRRVDISSTEIRLRIAQGLSIRYLVPEPVRLLIHSHVLYQPTHQRPAGNSLRASCN